MKVEYWFDWSCNKLAAARSGNVWSAGCLLRGGSAKFIKKVRPIRVTLSIISDT